MGIPGRLWGTHRPWFKSGFATLWLHYVNEDCSEWWAHSCKHQFFPTFPLWRDPHLSPVAGPAGLGGGVIEEDARNMLCPWVRGFQASASDTWMPMRRGDRGTWLSQISPDPRGTALAGFVFTALYGARISRGARGLSTKDSGRKRDVTVS